MLPAITDEHIREVAAAYNELKEIRYWKEKRKRFSFLVPGLSAEALWLLTFSSWFCVFNFRFSAVDETRFYQTRVSATNSVEFTDFLKLIHHYNRINITVRREKPLAQFLASCDRDHYEFYMSLMSKNFVKALPITRGTESAEPRRNRCW